MKIIVSFLVLAASLLISGCAATVKMSPQEESAKAKAFNPPSPGNAGVYVYRDNIFWGKSIKKDIWIDGKCLGESARGVFFYSEVAGGRTHKISTESEFSANSLELMFEAGKNYFIRQYIKPGMFVGQAGLEQMSEKDGMEALADLQLAQPGKCSSATP